MSVVIAIDAGTTGVRALAVDESGQPCSLAYRALNQHFPRPGWVEHDPDEIWQATCATSTEVIASIDQPVAAIGITNQRETVVVWDRRTGRPLQRAIVWQDRRTAARCEQLERAGHLELVRDLTGLVLDPYFSATKLEWLLTTGGVPADAGLAFGTVDSWLVWNLTGGAEHVTDPSNASRTMLYDITALEWSAELCELMGVPPGCLPEVRPSSGRFGLTADGSPLGAGIAVSGVAGDQQAALFGQACFTPGQAKNTYGSGSFTLMNLGSDCPAPVEGLLTTVAWVLDRPDGLSRTYAYEGAMLATGAAVSWLQDSLGLFDEPGAVGPLAESIPDTGGVCFVPALAGLGSPWWDPRARGTVVGITGGTGRAELARAAVESMAYQARDVIETMAAAGVVITDLRVDGGASVMDLLLQFQADQLGVPVIRSGVSETTALGAAYLAGLSEGIWSSLEELAGCWVQAGRFEPAADRSEADRLYDRWLRAVERSRRWADDD